MNIETNIPIPQRLHGSQRDTLEKMKPGESFVCPYSESPGWRSSASHMKKKLIIRKISPTEARIWLAP